MHCRSSTNSPIQPSVALCIDFANFASANLDRLGSGIIASNWISRRCQSLSQLHASSGSALNLFENELSSCMTLRICFVPKHAIGIRARTAVYRTAPKNSRCLFGGPFTALLNSSMMIRRVFSSSRNFSARDLFRRTGASGLLAMPSAFRSSLQNSATLGPSKAGMNATGTMSRWLYS